MLTVRIQYPLFNERLKCEPEAIGLVKLREFSEILPLVPGDMLTVDEQGLATDVHSLRDVYVVDAHFLEGTSRDEVLRIAGEWNLATSVRGEVLTATVASENRDWIEEVVGSEALVERILWRRAPGDTVGLHDDDENQID